MFLFSLDAATIREYPSSVLVTPGEDAQLYCVGDGNPLNDGSFSWRHAQFTESDMDERTSRTYKNGTSYLTVGRPTKDDNGPWDCVLSNGIGNETVRSIYLIVKCKSILIPSLC